MADPTAWASVSKLLVKRPSLMARPPSTMMSGVVVSRPRARILASGEAVSAMTPGL
jgi:hypothetical protein